MHIFLDFDGVFHPDAVVVPRNKPMELHAEGELFMHAPVLIDALAAFALFSIKLVKRDFQPEEPTIVLKLIKEE